MNSALYKKQKQIQTMKTKRKQVAINTMFQMHNREINHGLGWMS